MALEADLVLVLDHHGEEAAELVLLLLQVGVEQRVVALAPAPQHVVLAAQAVRRLEAVPHLGGGEAEHLRIGIGGAARHVARMAEQVGRAPQQLDAGRRHLRARSCRPCAEIRHVLADGVRLRHDVDVVEAEVRQPQPREELEGFVELEVRGRLIERAAVPRTAERAGAEHIEAVPAEGVPVADRHAQLLLPWSCRAPRDSCRSSERRAGSWIAGLRRRSARCRRNMNGSSCCLRK